MCKHLSFYIAKKVTSSDSSGWKVFLSQKKDSFTDCSSSKITIDELEYEDEESMNSQVLPNIQRRSSEIDLKQQPRNQDDEDNQTDYKRQRSHSIASFLPTSRMSEKNPRRPRSKWKRSNSMGCEDDQLCGDSMQSMGRKKKLEQLSRIKECSFSESLDAGIALEDTTSPDLVNILGTKSGMTAFWQFLKGKAGEANWLFWLDAERVKYYDGREQTR